MNLAEKISEISDLRGLCGRTAQCSAVAGQDFYPENPQSRGEILFPRLSAVMNERNIKIMAETLTLI